MSSERESEDRKRRDGETEIMFGLMTCMIYSHNTPQVFILKYTFTLRKTAYEKNKPYY